LSGEGLPASVLLDTCAVIWLANAETLTVRVVETIRHAGRTGGVFVSTASAWEIGLLSRPRVDRRPVPAFKPDPKTWFARFLAGPGIKETIITPAIAIDASYLPGDFHADPMDRLLPADLRGGRGGVTNLLRRPPRSRSPHLSLFSRMDEP
jgi:PIN domain nuclease of toxin-antitoxin system